MRIFKSKTFKRILSLVVLFTLFAAGNQVLGEVLRPVGYATYFNHDLQQIEESGQEADLVFIGASRMYRAFVPQVFEDTLEMDCVINAASSAQPISAGYHQLKDLIKRVQPKAVAIDVTWGGLSREPKLQAMLIVYDKLSPGGKLGYVADCFRGEELLYTLPIYRFRDNVDKVSKFHAKKQKLIESNYAPDTDDTEYYWDTGFAYNTKSYANGTIPIATVGTWNEKNVKQESKDYLDACIELCKENDINVILVSAPTSMMRLYKIRNYQEAYEYYCQYAQEQGVDYYNLNYLVNREEFLPDAMMCDDNHVNGEGAYTVSKVFAEILAKENAGIDTENYFYKSLDELKADVHRVVAVEAELEPDERTENLLHIKCNSLQNDDVKPYYMIEVSEDGGEAYTTKVNWTQDKETDIEIIKGEKIKIRVSAKSTLAGEAEAYQVYDYK